MPSDIKPIAIAACVCCGNGPDKRKLKRLPTMSRMWACTECLARWLFIANGDKQKAIFLLAREGDRQLAEHIGKQPTGRQCMRGCGSNVIANPDGRIPLFCSKCQREWVELGQGSEDYKAPDKEPYGPLETGKSDMLTNDESLVQQAADELPLPEEPTDKTPDGETIH